MRLSDTALRRLKPGPTPRKLWDGDGLYVLVQPTGRLWWRLDYRFAGKRKTLSFGTYPDVSLARARERRTEARRQLAEGRDPSVVRQDAKQHRDAPVWTFDRLAAEWLAQQEAVWAPATTISARHQVALLSEALGSHPIATIEPPVLLAVLRALERRGTRVTAQKAKQRAGQIFRYAIATGRAIRDPSADLRGALAPTKTTHRAALTDPADIARLMADLRAYTGSLVVATALQLLPLVFLRPSELRLATWGEFALEGDEPLWRLPAERMKQREPHLVPLSRQAVALLRALHVLTGPREGEAPFATFVFPSRVRRRAPLNKGTLLDALRRLGYGAEEMSAHGFRTLASTRLHEMGWNTDTIERQLAHRDPNTVRAVYNRAQHLTERRRMLQAWADYLDGLVATVAAKA